MHDATTVFKAVETVIEAPLTEMSVSYTRTVDHAGDQDKHRFIITGRTEDAQFIAELHEFLTEYETADIDLGHTAKGVFIALDFDDADIKNAPPEREDSFRTVTPHDPKTQTVSECSNCRSSTPQAYPPLVLRFESGEFEEPEEETHRLCVRCTPGHFDDVVRKVKAFGVDDGEIQGVLFEEQQVYNEETKVTETIGPTWIPREEIDNPYVNDVIPLIERDLLQD